MRPASFVRKIDWVLVSVALVIIGLGIATFYEIGDRSGDFIIRQVIFAGVGLALMLTVSLVDYRIFKNFSAASLAIYAVSIVLLAAALASSEIRGVSSWIAFRNLTFEPSEFAKLALIILLAKYFSQKHVEIYRSHHILASAVYTMIPAGMTLIQPDLGSTMIFLMIWLAMLLFSGIKRKHLLMIIMLGVVLSSIAWFAALKPYQRTRISSFVNPYLDPRGSGYNALQSQISVGSGRLTGITFGKEKTLETALVPEPYNDFAFATYARKFGFVGILLLISLVALLIYRVGSLAVRADNNFSRLFALGFMTLVFGHVLINAGMNMGIMPITGIPFSFLSYGGSHLVTLMTGLGIIQNIRINSRN